MVHYLLHSLDHFEEKHIRLFRLNRFFKLGNTWDEAGLKYELSYISGSVDWYKYTMIQTKTIFVKSEVFHVEYFQSKQF